MHKMLLSIAAAATVLAGAPALATNPTAPSATIVTGDLDLSRPGDARKLARRIAGAKETVCGSYAHARDDEEARITACRADVARQIEPQLAALRSKAQLANR